MRLVRRHADDELRGADQLVVEERAQDDPAALLGVADVVLVDGARVPVRERRQVADRSPAGDAVGEHPGELVQSLARLGRGKSAHL